MPTSRWSSPHQLEDLRLNGDVERGRRLVGDQQLGSQASAMAIITRCRMPPDIWCGYTSNAAARIRDADQLQHLDRAFACASRALSRWCSAHDLGDLVANRVDRIEARHRLLEDHRDFVAANGLHRLLVELAEIADPSIAAAKEDLAGSNPTARRPNKAHDRKARDRLARPALADQSHSLARLDAQIDAIDRTHGAAILDSKFRRQAAHLDERRLTSVRVSMLACVLVFAQAKWPARSISLPAQVTGT